MQISVYLNEKLKFKDKQTHVKLSTETTKRINIEEARGRMTLTNSNQDQFSAKQHQQKHCQLTH